MVFAGRVVGLFKEDGGCEGFEEMMECEGLGRWRIKNELECEGLGGAQKIKQGCKFLQPL